MSTTRARVGEREVFQPVRVGSLVLRNRFVRAAAFEGRSPDGGVSEDLVRFHEQLAKGGVGLTTVAYGGVAESGRAYPHQLCLWRPGVFEGLRTLVGAVHRHGAAVSLQLAHAGHAANPAWSGGRTIAPSAVRNRFNGSRPRAMDEADLEAVATAFANAAAGAAGAGFDAVEVHSGHGYLLSQFLSPYTNRRSDALGGSIDGRLRFPVQVLQRVRDAVGARFPIFVKMNLRDGFRGGLEIDEAVAVARRFEAEGADALVLSGGFMTRTPFAVMRGDVPYAALRRTVRGVVPRLGAALFARFLLRPVAFREAYFLEDARKVRRAVRLPLALVGGLRTLDGMEQIVREGFELLALARPLVREPDLVQRFASGAASASRCEPCNECLATVARGPLFCPRALDANSPP
jgi:2,4-dienoyl-CoA reductase-like NADH-dependent reductase (Old Yellow Enzyme family)